jgi:diphthine-ammonia ligase
MARASPLAAGLTHRYLSPMQYALMSSGGKDSTLALDRARRQNLDVKYLVNLYDGESNRVRFHGVRSELIELQARALGLEPISTPTKGSKYEPAFLDTLHLLKKRNVVGVIFGNISLQDVRSWYEERVTGSGLKHLEPIWGEPSIEVAWEVVERGYQAVVVSVDLSLGAAAFLGREFDADLVTDLGCTDGLDAGGEHGEYHTFVYDGPSFETPVLFSKGRTVEFEGHRFVDLMPTARH